MAQEKKAGRATADAERRKQGAGRKGRAAAARSLGKGMAGAAGSLRRTAGRKAGASTRDGGSRQEKRGGGRAPEETPVDTNERTRR